MKVCPKCGKQWPETGKFCPMDGTPLVAEIEEEEPESRPTRLLGPDELPGAESKAQPVKPSAPAAKPAQPTPKPPEPAAKPAQPPPTPAAHAAKRSPPPPGAPAAKSPPSPPEEAPPAEPDRPGTFSETKWFMIGEHIKDEEIEASDLPVEDLQEIYKRTGTLPEEVRKKYSLRYGTDEDRSSGGGSKKKK